MPVNLTPIIERGVIDNTARDSIKLELHVVRMKQPLIFTMEGNCRRDIAGRCVKFERIDKAPRSRLRDAALYEHLDTLLLHRQQLITGDITLSHRAMDPAAPSRIANMLSIEFFDGALMRYLIEGNCFSFSLSEATWICSASCEAVQELLNMSALRDMLLCQIERYRGPAFKLLGDDMPSCKWDRVMNRAEAYLSAAFAVQQKYMMHPRRALAEAFVLNHHRALAYWAENEDKGQAISYASATKWKVDDFLEPAEARLMNRALDTPALNIAAGLAALIKEAIVDPLDSGVPTDDMCIAFAQTYSNLVTLLLSTILLTLQKRVPIRKVTTRLRSLESQFSHLAQKAPALPQHGRDQFRRGTSRLCEEIRSIVASIMPQ